MRATIRAQATRTVLWLTWRLRVARMWTALVAAAVAVRCIPLPRLSALLGLRLEDVRRSSGQRSDGAARDATCAVRLTRAERRNCKAVERAVRRWPTSHGTCLYEALVLGCVLRRHAPILRMGVAPAGTTIHAHAWLEVDGSTIGARHGFTELSASAGDAR